jgi:DNA-binding transcriptional regulator YhcF (GntR family)
VDIVLNRRGGVPVRDQLVTQLEMKILDGSLAMGQRLPSVRALARRLKIHHNTVSAAYQDLEASGRVKLRRGAGVFVQGRGPTTPGEARGLDEMIRLSLHAAFRKGFTGPEIRSAVERWLAAAPPDRVVVVDPAQGMAELLMHEIRQTVGVPTSCCTDEDLAREPHRLSGALVLVLPYHEEMVRRVAPAASLEILTLAVHPRDREAILAMPEGSIVLVVSHAPTLLPFASVFLRSLRGDEIVVEAHLLGDGRAWRRLVKAADLVLADALAVEAVRRAGARRLREIRVVSEEALGRLREAMTVVAPVIEARARPAPVPAKRRAGSA